MKDAFKKFFLITLLFLSPGATFACFNISLTIGDIPRILERYVADTIVDGIVNLAISSLTASITNWANSGFEGKPAFSQNFNRELKNLENDEFAGVLNDINIEDAKNGAKFNVGGFLCGPFSQELRDAFRVRLALAKGAQFKHSSCTIEGVLAQGGRTLQDFENDFTQGGWPAWLELTTNPVNNRYGAFFNVQEEVWRRQAAAASDRQQQLTYGNGFLSQKVPGDCILYASEVDPSFVGPHQAGSDLNIVGPPDAEGCLQRGPDKIVTPGQVINTHIAKALGLGEDKLVATHAFNEMINAVAYNFVLKIFQSSAGLFGASSGDNPITTQLAQAGQQDNANAQGNANSSRDNATHLVDTSQAIDAKQSELNQCNADLNAIVVRQITVVNPDGTVTVKDNPDDLAKKKAKQAECDNLAGQLQALKDKFACEVGGSCGGGGSPPGGAGGGCTISGTEEEATAGEEGVILHPSDFSATKDNSLEHFTDFGKAEGKSFSSVVIDFDLNIGQYDSSCPSTFGGGCYHQVLWFMRGKSWCTDNAGYAIIVGPNKQKLKLETSIYGEGKGQKTARFGSGSYHVRYQVGGGTATINVGDVPVSLGSVQRLNIKKGAFIDFGQTQGDGPEVATPPGWRWSNIEIQLTP